MPDTRNEEDRAVESGPPHEGSGTPGENARKPYRAPHLRYLGSVREITAGPFTQDRDEGGGARKSVALG